jgi:hypothetical protein
LSIPGYLEYLYVCVTGTYSVENEPSCQPGASARRPHKIWVLHPLRRAGTGPSTARGGFGGRLETVFKCKICPYTGGVNHATTTYPNPGHEFSAQMAVLCGYFRFLFAYTVLMFPGPESSKLVVVQCKGCHENIPAPVEGMPAQPIATRCPLCHEHRRYLPSEVFLGRLSHLMIRKPVRTADGRVG